MFRSIHTFGGDARMISKWIVAPLLEATYIFGTQSPQHVKMFAVRQEKIPIPDVSLIYIYLSFL